MCAFNHGTINVGTLCLTYYITLLLYILKIYSYNFFFLNLLAAVTINPWNQDALSLLSAESAAKRLKDDSNPNPNPHPNPNQNVLAMRKGLIHQKFVICGLLLSSVGDAFLEVDVRLET